MGLVNQSAAEEPLHGGERPISEQPARAGRSRVGPRRNWLYGIVIIVTLSIVAFNIIRPITVLPRIIPSPGFSLVNADGQPVTSEDQRGRLTLYSFTYLDCPADACPQSLDDIAALRDAVAAGLPADTPLSFVTISLDPKRDTPERLRAAVQSLGSGSNSDLSWQLLTGDPLRTRYTVGGGFGVYYSEPKESTPESPGRVTFDPRYVLVDGLGIMRAEYRAGSPDPQLIKRDVNLLIEEAANSDGIARLGYEAAHLFLCYPR